MSKTNFDVVIVGAGIAGSALACALAEQSIAVAIVDAGAVPLNKPQKTTCYDELDPRVLALTHISSEFLKKLGVWENIQSLGASPYTSMHVWDADGTASIDFSCDDVACSELGLIVENRSVVWALQAQLKAKGVVIFEQAKIELLHGSVLVLDNGMSIEADLIVGADGGNSTVRRLAGIDTHEHNSEQFAVVCHIETEQAHAGAARQRFLSTGPLAVLPVTAVSANTASVVWSLDVDCVDNYLAMDDKAFKRALAKAFEFRLGDITKITPRFSFPLIAKHAAAYRGDNWVLIGDAAHVVHPLAGQGINLGLQDVIALSELLCDAKKRGIALNSERVLSAYQRARRGENMKMLALMQGFKSLFGRRELPFRWLRNEGMRFVNSQSKLKQAIIKQAMGL